MEDALPKCSVKYGRMASNTSGRTGVGALLSRYTRRGGIPIYFTRVGINREHRYRGSAFRRRHVSLLQQVRGRGDPSSREENAGSQDDAKQRIWGRDSNYATTILRGIDFDLAARC